MAGADLTGQSVAHGSLGTRGLSKASPVQGTGVEQSGGKGEVPGAEARGWTRKK